MTSKNLLVSCLVLLLTACGNDDKPTGDPKPKDEPAPPLTGESTPEPETDPRIVSPDHLPTPYSADEIREHTPAGRMILSRTREKNRPPYFQAVQFREGTDKFAKFVKIDYPPNIEPQVFPLANQTWEDLQRHAALPKDKTKRSEVTISTPLGELDCWLYTFIRPGADKRDVLETRLWFDKDRPGPPVRFVTLRNGKVEMEMETVSDEVVETIYDRDTPPSAPTQSAEPGFSTDE